jgi:uncharacterized membrane protein YkvA (DUF1232 family)
MIKRMNNKHGKTRDSLMSYIRLIPKFLALLIDLLRDPRVSSQDKAILGATVAYVLNPVDLIPDWIPFMGLMDDIYLVPMALLRLIAKTDENILQEHWKGSEDVIHVLKNCAGLAVNFLPGRIKNALVANITTTQNEKTETNQ